MNLMGTIYFFENGFQYYEDKPEAVSFALPVTAVNWAMECYGNTFVNECDC